jgi:hypothetical protein
VLTRPQIALATQRLIHASVSDYTKINTIMILLNMMIGSTTWVLGLIFLLLVSIIEAVILSKGLTKRWLNYKILTIVTVSNVISTFAGLFSLIWTIVINTIEIIFKSQSSL